MCSELFRIPYVWGGVPMFGFGVLLAVWAVVSLVSLVLLVRRHGWGTETWSYVLLLSLFGAAILLLPKFYPEGFPIRGYGLMVLAGAATGVALAIHRARQAGLHHDVILSLAFWMFICGIVGGRLFYVIEYWNVYFSGRSLARTLVDVLSYTEGGLVIYGALIGGAAAFVWFTRKHKLPTLALADLIAPSLMVGLAFGRIGCLLNGCCYGGPTERPWAVTFPPMSPAYQDQVAHGEMYGFRIAARAGASGVAVESSDDAITSINGRPVHTAEQAMAALVEAFAARQPLTLQLASGRNVVLPAAEPPARSRPVHPTQIYSAINAGLLAWFLWSYYPLRRRDGEVIALMLTIYSVTRFLLEILRIDESPVFGTPWSISQNISLAMLAGAVGLWLFLGRRPRRLAWTSASSVEPHPAAHATTA